MGIAQFTVEDVLGALTHVNLDQKNPPLSGGNGDGCEYVVGESENAPTGVPSCVIGTVIANLDPAFLPVVANASGAQGKAWTYQPEHVKRNFTPEANSFIVAVQQHADMRKGTWRESLRAAGAVAHTTITNDFGL